MEKNNSGKARFIKKVNFQRLIPLLFLSFIFGTGCFEASVGPADQSVYEPDSNQPSEDHDNNYIPGVRNYSGYMRLSHNDFCERNGNSRFLNMFGIKIKGIIVTITSIEINSETMGWTEIVNYGEKGKKIDLMQFKNGNTAEISYFNLKPDIYSQIRLHLTRESILVIEKNGAYSIKSLIVPSHVDPEIKIVGSMEVVESGLTSITVKFDPLHSIHFAPGQGFMLKPAFRIIDMETTPSVTETISSADGGEINVFGEFSAQMPSGAFPEDTDVTLTLIGMPLVMPFSSTFIIGNVYDMGPQGTRLAENMTLVMNYHDSEIEEKKVDESCVDIYYFDNSVNDWYRTMGTTDMMMNTVTASTDTFTMFGIGGPPLTAPRIEPASIVKASNESGESRVPLKVTAKITDPDGIANAMLYYRESGEFAFNMINMTAAGDGWYEAVIPLSFLREQLSSTGIEVFIESADNSGEVSFAPVTAAISPHLYTYNPDMDADGMNDRWEVENGLNITVNDSAADPDNDGLNNIEEYTQATDPQAPEFKPAPEDIDSVCVLEMVPHAWTGDIWDFPMITSGITVLPPNSAEEFKVLWGFSFTRFYIIEADYVMFAYKTDSVNGDTGSMDYIEPSMSVVIYDDYLHINEFYTVINGRLWTPLPAYDDFSINYTASAWNSDGGSYSEDFSFTY